MVQCRVHDYLRQVMTGRGVPVAAQLRLTCSTAQYSTHSGVDGEQEYRAALRGEGVAAAALVHDVGRN